MLLWKPHGIRQPIKKKEILNSKLGGMVFTHPPHKNLTTVWLQLFTPQGHRIFTIQMLLENIKMVAPPRKSGSDVDLGVRHSFRTKVSARWCKGTSSDVMVSKQN